MGTSKKVALNLGKPPYMHPLISLISRTQCKGDLTPPCVSKQVGVSKQQKTPAYAFGWNGPQFFGVTYSGHNISYLFTCHHLPFFFLDSSSCEFPKKLPRHTLQEVKREKYLIPIIPYRIPVSISLSIFFSI